MKLQFSWFIFFLASWFLTVDSIELEQLPGNILASSLPSRRGYTTYGAAQSPTGMQSGSSVKFVGDVNKDGYGDYVIGAKYGTYLTRQYCGLSYLVYGGPQANPADVDLGSLTSSTGFRVIGAIGNDLSGTAVAGGMDVNNDGFADFLIGAYNSNPTVNNVARSYAGTSYLIFGKASRTTDIDLSSLSPSDGLIFRGSDPDDYSGRSLSRAGDINGDGFEDFIIGASSATRLSRSQAGVAYVIYGGNSLTSIDLKALTSSQGFQVIGPSTNAYAGWAISNAGDFNKDGVADFMVGAYGAGSSAQGVVYLIFGKKNTPFSNIDLSTFTTSQGIAITGRTAGDQFGFSLSYAGDFNGDKTDDIIVGANFRDPKAEVGNGGAAYIIYGKQGINTNIDAAVFPNSDGFDIYGMGTNFNLGVSVSGGGDIDKDGYSDVIIGANQQPVGSTTNAGVAYVLAGKPSATTTIFSDKFTTSDGFIISGIGANDYLGSVVDLSGDITGDGFADIIVSAPLASPQSRTNAGSTYVFIGGDYTPTAIPTAAPTATPTATPSAVPSAIPTAVPTAIPSATPTEIPTATPTATPTANPTEIPTYVPSAIPSEIPTYVPSAAPTNAPTASPSAQPTSAPSATPTVYISRKPTAHPTPYSNPPTFPPTARPTFRPTVRPTFAPTLNTKAQVSFNLYFNFSNVKGNTLSSAGLTALALTFQKITGLPLDNIAILSLIKSTNDPIVRRQLEMVLRRQLQLTSGFFTLLYGVLFKVDLATNPSAVENNNVNGLCNDYKAVLQTALQDGTFTAILQEYALQLQASELYEAQTTTSTTATTSECKVINNGTDSGGGGSVQSTGSASSAQVSDSIIAAIVIVVLFFFILFFCCCYIGIAYYRKQNEEKVEYQERNNQSMYSGINTTGEEFEMGDNTVMMFLSSDDAEEEADAFGFVKGKRKSQVNPVQILSDEEEEEGEDEEEGDEEEGEEEEEEGEEEEDGENHNHVMITIQEENEIDLADAYENYEEN